MAANLKNDRMVVTNMPTKEMGMLYTIKYLPDEALALQRMRLSGADKNTKSDTLFEMDVMAQNGWRLTPDDVRWAPRTFALDGNFISLREVATPKVSSGIAILFLFAKGNETDVIKILTSDCIVMLRTRDQNATERLRNVIEAAMKKVVGARLMSQKAHAAEHALHLLQQQAGEQQQLFAAEPASPDKKGMLEMWNGFQWLPLECTVRQRALWWSVKDSTDIVSFVSLSQAALYLDCEFFKEGHWAFSIKTPLRVVRFRAVHAISLTEWVLVLKKAIAGDAIPGLQQLDMSAFNGDIVALQLELLRQKRETDAMNETLDIVLEMRDACVDLEELIATDDGCEQFANFVGPRLAPNVRCLRMAFQVFDTSFHKDSEKRAASLDAFQSTYLAKNAPTPLDQLEDIPKDVINEIQKDLKDGPLESRTLVRLVDHLVGQLISWFVKFTNSDAYETMIKNGWTKVKVDMTEGSETAVFSLAALDKKGKRYDLDSDNRWVTIGRDLGKNDIIVSDKKVSRTHAKILYGKHSVQLFDLDSWYGTLVNGTRCSHAHLKPGDTFTIGPTTFQLQIHEPKKAMHERLITKFKQKLGISKDDDKERDAVKDDADAEQHFEADATDQETLGDLLRTTEGFSQFRAYLEKQFASESLLFWRDAQVYRKEFGTSFTGFNAISIYTTYLQKGAPMEVNLPSSMLRHFRDVFGGIDEGDDDSDKRLTTVLTEDIFDDACHELVKLMEVNSFTQFKAYMRAEKQREEEALKGAKK